MAEADIKLLKNTKISVYIEEVQPDILVVTYEFGVRIFKGVLLDSTKRNLPCGIPNINPAFNTPTKNPDDDTLYAVNQRFAYMDPNSPKKKNVQMSSKYKSKISKMTVRLRPRQVLCSKCKGICNENSENVSRKRKTSETPQNLLPPPARRNANSQVTKSANTVNSKKGTREKGPSLVPKLSRLTFQEESSVGAKTNTNSRKLIEKNDQKDSQETGKKRSLDHSADSQSEDEETPLRSKRLLKKRKNASSVSDQLDNSQQESANRNNNQTSQQNSNPTNPDQTLSSSVPTSNTTRTIKISYGPQGEGTVLKIPAKIDTLSPDDDSEENMDIEPKTEHNRAVRKAMRKAKKAARRKIVLAGGSPIYLGMTSPRYTIGGASPRQGIGGNSPRYKYTPYDMNPRRRKHKVKHKKKHKEDRDRKHREEEQVSSTQDDFDSKEHCITQKLSINLKRLSDTNATQNATDKIEYISSSDEQSEAVPNFPPPNPPLMLRINSQTLSSAIGADGVRLLVGDIVWGKILGFPWWPGKILAITNCTNQGTQAHVAWYGSSTSSLMQCDQLSHYLDNFKVRYSKKKKGPYKEAIKQATTEARENAENRVRQPLGNSPSHNIIQVAPPALSSPRQIDVAS